MSAGDPVILFIDDEPVLLELYTTWFSSDYEVRTARNGREGLETLDETIDVVVLDRRMPDMSGDEVLERIRESGHGCPVAMVTAVEPGFDILELGFDDYVTKPVEWADLQAVIDGLLRRATFDRAVQQYYSLATKRAALEAKKPTSQLALDDRYRALSKEIEAYEAELRGSREEFEPVDFEQAFRDLLEDLRGRDSRRESDTPS